jgi:hypothetical protein
MPDDNVSAEERAALILKILASKAFTGSEDLPKLFSFLADNAGKLLSSKDIEALHYKRAGQHFNPNHSRERVSKLKDRLAAYEAEHPDEFVKCELPNADDIGGYQLRVRKVTEGVSACRRLWAAHLESEKQVSVVCDPLLFFFDFAEGQFFRFVDTNIEGLSRKSALRELQARHGRSYKGNLSPGHFYIDVGSLMAAERIREYFKSASGVHPPLMMEKESNRQWLKQSPVVIGTARTNPAIASIMGSRAAEFLSYRLHPEKFAWVRIRDFSEQSDIAKALKSLECTPDANGDFLTPHAEITVGIVSRIANPAGAGVMTFICSDGVFTTKQIAAALTDEKQLRRIFQKMGWRLDQKVPETFEMMFLVRLWPGGMDDEGAEAELLGGRFSP